jgi:cyclase
MKRISLVLALGLLAPLGAEAQNFDTIQVRATRVSEGVWMLTGAGGNIGVSAGENGVFLVDDQYAPLTPKIQAALATVSPQAPRFVLNTHWHGDHTGGNENLGKAGALIVAQDNVRRRMSVEQFNEVFNRRTPPSPPAALPVVTFSETVTFYLNGDTIHVFHVPPAHTDGDALVHFRRANVIHMGDTFFNGNYPFVDVSSGGSLEGVIGAADRVLALANPDTKIIPGHGPLADRRALQAYRDMLVQVRDRVRRLIAERKTLEQSVAAKPLADLDATWGRGFINSDRMVTFAYQSLSRR